MTYIMVDVESDGPIPGDYSMVALGAVVCDSAMDKRFLAYIRPISDKWIPEALAVGGFNREQTQAFSFNGLEAMKAFDTWVNLYNFDSRPMFISDNNGFDWQFVNWYFHHFLGRNPFGYSSTNLGSLYKGMVKDAHQNFKHLRKTRHTHNPIVDCIGNIEAFLAMQKMGLIA